VHFSLVFKDLESFCYRWLVTDNSPGLLKVPDILETIAAEVVFPGCLLKWFGALGAEWFPQ